MQKFRLCVLMSLLSSVVIARSQLKHEEGRAEHDRKTTSAAGNSKFNELKNIFDNPDSRNPSVAEVDALSKEAEFECLDRSAETRSTDEPGTPCGWSYNPDGESKYFGIVRTQKTPFALANLPGAIYERSFPIAPGSIPPSVRPDLFMQNQEGKAVWSGGSDGSQVRMVLKWSPKQKKMLMKRVEILTSLDEDGNTMTATIEAYCTLREPSSGPTPSN